MDENEAVDKMRELKRALETALRYEKSGESFPEAFLLILIAILISAFVSLLVNIYNFEKLSPFLGNIPVGHVYYISVGIPISAIFAIISVVVYRIFHRPFTVPLESSWDEYLNEGAIGIMHIIEITDWEEILFNLKRAKVAFVVLSTLTLLFYLGIIFILLFFTYGILITDIFGVPINVPIIILVSIIVVIGLGDRTIRQSYKELWRMDNLIVELRWFYSEFQNTGI